MSLSNVVKILTCIMSLLMWHMSAEAYVLLPAASPQGSNHLSAKDLVNAIIQGDHIDRIRILANKPETDLNEVYGMCTPLATAAMIRETDVEVMRVLLDAGADINATIKDGETALIWAAHSGHVEGLKYLLRRGANVNAICSKDSSVYKALLTVDPNFSGKCNAFNISYCRFFPEAMRALVEAGADPNDMYCLDRLILILENDHDFLKFLVDNGFNLNMQDETGETLLLQSLIANKTEIVEEVIKLGADVNVGAREGNITPLMLAVLKEDKKMVELLLKHGAKPDAVASTDDTQGITALHLAALKGNFHIVKLLLEHGATPDKEDSDGFNAFDIATKQGHDKLAEFLKTKAKIHRQKAEREDSEEAEYVIEQATSTRYVFWGLAGCMGVLLLVVILFTKKKKPVVVLGQPRKKRVTAAPRAARPAVAEHKRPKLTVATPKRSVSPPPSPVYSATPPPFVPAADAKIYMIAMPDGSQAGPYSLDELHYYLLTGVFTPYTPVWCSGMPNWVPLSSILS